MSVAKAHHWSLKEFLEWEARQDRRYEFVGGQAVLMAGGTQAHALIAANLVSSLRPLLRGSACRPVGSDLRVMIPVTGNVRYPDVTIDCGRFDPSSIEASEPAVVFEILSRSTGWYDQTQKLRDYESIASIAMYVCVSQSETRVSVWLRNAEGRFVAQDDMTASSDTLSLFSGSCILPLGEIYDGIVFPETPSMSDEASRPS